MAISRTSKYYDLRFIVQCKQPLRGYWETIAAFDCEPAAIGYSNECRKDRLTASFEYRIMKRFKGGWKEYNKRA